MFKTELHVHTRFSKDSLLSLRRLYGKCLRKGIEYIAITEHNNINGALAFREYCGKKGDKVKVIVGEEIMTTDGEIIGLFLSEPIASKMSPGETIEAIKAQNGVVYVPHPYDIKRSKTVLKTAFIEAYKQDIDCIESHNGRNISESYDAEQRKIAETNKIPQVVGSDAHTAMEIGRNYMLFEVEPTNAQAFRQAIASSSCNTKKCIKFAHTVTKFDKLIKRVFK